MKNRLLLLLTLLTFCLFSGQSFAQVNKEVFREFEVDDFLSSSMTLGKKGMIMHGWKDKSTYKIKLLDTDLEDKEEWTLTLNRSATLYNIEYYKKGEKLFLMFRTGKKKCKLHCIDLKANEITSAELLLPKKVNFISDLAFVKKNIWILGTSKKKSVIFRIPMEKMSAMTMTEMAFDKTKSKPYPTALTVLDANEIAFVYQHGGRKSREFDITILDDQCKTKIKSVLNSLSVEKRRFMYSVDITRLAEEEYSVAGMYHRSAKAMPEGVYFMKYGNNKVDYYSQFAYIDMKDFPKSKRAEKRKAKGKDVSVYYMAKMHPTFKMENGDLIMLAEYYYPTYRTETYTTYVNGKPQTQTRQVFDGYYYSHAMAIAVDEKGDKEYDVFVPLRSSYKPFSVITFLRVRNTGTELSILNISGSTIYSSNLVDGKLTQREREFTNHIPKNQREKYSYSSAAWWYGQNFLIMQRQTVKEKGLLGKRSTHYYGLRVEVPEA